MSRVENANLFEIVTDDRPLSADSTKINELCAELSTYLEPHQVEEVYRAFLLGAKAHEGQSRVSGAPYISHPVEVA
jgi:GTP pyrophosphokinase